MFLSVVIFYLRLYFPSMYFQIKAKRSVLNSWWPLERGENNIRTLIGTTKRQQNRSGDYYKEKFDLQYHSPIISGPYLVVIQIKFLWNEIFVSCH